MGNLMPPPLKRASGSLAAIITSKGLASASPEEDADGSAFESASVAAVDLIVIFVSFESFMFSIDVDVAAFSFQGDLIFILF